MPSGIVRFLKHKYGFLSQKLSFEMLEKIASYEGITIKWIKFDEKNSGSICWGRRSRMHRPIIFLRGENRKSGMKKPGAWFTLAHELGHFYLHPYMKYFDIANYGPFPNDETRMGLIGYTELEADQFATYTFITMDELDKRFEARTIRAILKINDDDTDDTIEKVLEDIYTYCKDKTREIPGFPNPQKPMNRKARRNLRIRSQNYVDNIRKKIIIHCDEFPNKYDASLLSENEIESLINGIKNTMNSYQAKL